MLTTDDLVRSDNCFFAATGITDGELLQGVRYHGVRRNHPVAGHAVVSGHGPRSSTPDTRSHKLAEYSAIEFG